MPIPEGSLVLYSDSEGTDEEDTELADTNTSNFTQYYDLGETRFIQSRTLKSTVLMTKIIPRNIDIPIENPTDHVDLIENIIASAVNTVLDLYRATENSKIGIEIEFPNLTSPIISAFRKKRDFNPSDILY